MVLARVVGSRPTHAGLGLAAKAAGIELPSLAEATHCVCRVQSVGARLESWIVLWKCRSEGYSFRSSDSEIAGSVGLWTTAANACCRHQPCFGRRRGLRPSEPIRPAHAGQTRVLLRARSVQTTRRTREHGSCHDGRLRSVNEAGIGRGEREKPPLRKAIFSAAQTR